MVSLVKRGCAVCILANGRLSRTGFDEEAKIEPKGYRELTSRELEVLHLVLEGLTNRRIGTTLHLAETTVKKHVSRAMSKIAAANRVEAALVVARYEADHGHE